MMKEKQWIILVLSAALLLIGNSASALEPGGNVRYDYSESAGFEDGQKTSESNGLNQNYNFNLNNEITPLSSYSFSLRSNLSDFENVDSEGVETKSYKRKIEPGLDFSLSNPMYNLGMGYRHQEQWTARELSDESRKTNENFYNRLSLNPYLLPSLSLQFDRNKEYDHLSVQKTDTTNTGYALNSSYELPSDDIDMNMNLNLSRDINETPLSNIEKTITDSFNGGYNVSYSARKFNGVLNPGFNYSGTYSQNKTKQFVNVSGDMLLKRLSLGYYALGSIGNENVGNLTSELGLVNSDLNTQTLAGIDFNADKYHNIGIGVPSRKSVEKIYIYVKKDISGDINLAAAGNWRVYKSDFNLDNTWTLVPINSVNITAFDAANNVYRYEIKFTNRQEASYFKAVNMELSSVANVLVTEIEAYGLENIPDTNITSRTKSLGQRIGASIAIVPSKKLRFNLNYSIDRSDSNPESPGDAILDIFQDAVSKDTEESGGSVATTVMRNYGITSSWEVHKLLSSGFRISRSENYDKKSTTDNSSNSYGISLNSSPLPTIGSSLSLTRSDRFEFNEKKGTNNSAVLSMALKLYENVDMIQDMGYTNSKSFDDDSESNSYHVGGSLDIVFTPKLSENIVYSVIWRESNDNTPASKNIATNITYRPGRLVNINCNLNITDSNGEISSAQGIAVDWLPLKRLRFNFSYRHENSADSTKDDKLSIFSKWNITKSIDTQISYAYTKNQKDKEKESQTLSMNMNGRF